MTPKTILLVIAAVCFLLAALPLPLGVRVEWIGVMFYILSLLV